MAYEKGPYLNFALLCEKVLNEADGVVSFIRLVDRITFSVQTVAPSGAELPPPLVPIVPIVLAVGFKGGDHLGSLEAKIRIETPSGFKWPEVRQSVLFEGADRGANLILSMQFPAQDEGLYWFVVELGDIEITRVPLRVVKNLASQSVPPQIG